MNVLITSAGQRVSLVKFFQKELYDLFPSSKVFTTDMKPLLAPACHVSDRWFKTSKVDDKNYVAELLDVCLKHGVRLIVPTIDTELAILATNRELFESNGINVVVSDIDFINICRDKRKTNQFFINHNIDIPKQYSTDNLSYPVFVKPYDGSLSKGIRIVTCENDMSDECLLDEKNMFMELVSFDEYDEYTVDCYFDRLSILKCVVPRKRILVRAGEVNKAITNYNYIVSLFNEAIPIIKGARGCLTIQVFLHKKEDKVMGIEINPRFGGGYPLSYLANANYIKWIIQEYYLDLDIKNFNGWERNLLMLRYDSEVLVHEQTE